MRELASQTLERTGDPSAVEVLRELLHSDRETTRLQAAVALLRNGVPEPGDTAGKIAPGSIILPPVPADLENAA